MATHNAKEILQEALDTIKATYWIKGKEFELVSYKAVWNEDNHDYDKDWTAFNKAEKAIQANLDASQWANIGSYQPEGDKAKVTGVCSIGALALANVTLYDEPLVHWENISQRDPATWLAGAALAMAILTVPGNHHLAERSDSGEIIADWNDADDTTRQDVIAAFEKALTNPLLEATEVWTIETVNSWARDRTALVFASEAEAEAFIGREVELMEYVRDVNSSQDFKITLDDRVPGKVSA